MAEDASIRPPIVRALNLLRKPAALIFAVLLLLLIPYLLKYLSRQPPPLPPPPAERTLGLQEFINDLKTEMATSKPKDLRRMRPRSLIFRDSISRSALSCVLVLNKRQGSNIKSLQRRAKSSREWKEFKN
jgi:hypothetical protein